MLIFLFKKLLDWLRSLEIWLADSEGTRGKSPYINESLEILIKAGEVILPLVILCNQGLLALEQLLSRLFKFLALRMFVVYPRHH
jgi:hypothetical protein